MQLVVWCARPVKPFQLFDILATVPDAHLEMVARLFKTQAIGRVAWAELAKRWGYFDFAVGVAASARGTAVTFTTMAPPIHRAKRMQVN
jgi:hypothetical protein